MSERRKKNWIKIFTPDNEDKIASPDYVKKLMGIDLSNIHRRLIRLEEKMDKLESPQRQEKIIDALRGQGKHNRSWLENRVTFQWYDLGPLIEKGIIVESHSGSQRMIELNEELDRKCL